MLVLWSYYNDPQLHLDHYNFNNALYHCLLNLLDQLLNPPYLARFHQYRRKRLLKAPLDLLEIPKLGTQKEQTTSHRSKNGWEHDSEHDSEKVSEHDSEHTSKEKSKQGSEKTSEKR